MSAKQIVMAAAGASGPVNYIEDVFSTFLYTGNGSIQTITNGIDLSTKGGLVWIKPRIASPGGYSTDHTLTDTARGAQNYLRSNTTTANTNGNGAVQQFNSNGFGVEFVSGGANPQANESGVNFASWTFRKQLKFFDVVTWTKGTNTNNRISHALGSTPGCIIIKSITNGSQWFVWHRTFSNPLRNYLSLNATVEVSTAGADFWGASAPTATDFGINDSIFGSAGEQWVAYLFAHDAGGFGLSGTDNVISCGSVTLSAGVATASLGWEPQFVLLKRTDSTSDWWQVDSMRGMPVSGTGARLSPNNINVEAAVDNPALPNATGFTTNAAAFGTGNNGTYIYIAIRRGPMRVPTSGTSVYSPASIAGDGTNNRNITGVGFSPDLIVHQCSSASGVMGADWRDVLRGLDGRLQSDNTSAEFQGLGFGAASRLQDGYKQAASASSEWNISGRTYAEWRFRRAPGFFDVVCYTGTGSAMTVNHNLGVAPEFWIIKARNSVTSGLWFCEYEPSGIGLRLNQDLATVGDYGLSWSATSVTLNSGSFNGSGSTHVMYLFASLPGVSKVGSYTGNGSSQTINCGFTGGARFVLIKRTDSTGDWYVWDTARGIVAANDPHLSLNSTAAEVTTNDSIDPDNSGFIVNQVAATNINVSSATYIYLAIA